MLVYCMCLKDSKFIFAENFYLSGLDSEDKIENLAKSTQEDQIICLIMVHSSTDNFERRILIRKTWAQKEILAKYGLKILFFVGQTLSKTVQNSLLLETNLHKDVIKLETFTDTYRNLTLKSLESMTWVSKYYPNNLLTLKMDDDIFVNVFQLNKLLIRMKLFGNLRKSIVGLKIASHPVNINEKFHVEKSEYSNSTYPSYCVGAAYMMTVETSQLLISVKDQVPLLWIEDIYVTGLLRQKVGVEIKDISKFYIFGDVQPVMLLLKGIIFAHLNNKNPEFYTYLWTVLNDFIVNGFPNLDKDIS